MLNIKYAINNLIRNPMNTLLITIQIIVALILLYTNVCYKNEMMNAVSKINYLINDKGEVFVLKNQSDTNLQNVSISSLEKFNKYINDSKKFKHIAAVNDNCFVKTFKGKENFIESSNIKEQNNDTYVLVPRLSVGNGFFSHFNLKIKQGRSFNNDDYGKSEDKLIPVILGNNYSKIYKLGDQIQSLNEFNKIIKFQVVGFLESDSYFGDGSSGSNMQSLDSYIIYPEITSDIKDINMSEDDNEMNYKIFLYNKIFDSYLIVNNYNSSNISDIQNEMNNCNILDNEDFNIKLQSINDNLNSYKTMIKQIITTIDALFIIIFLFASIGFISSLLYCITDRFKEFGVHLMHGATLISISMITFYQILFTMLSSYIISIIFISFLFNSDPILKLNLYSCIEMLIFTVILSILLSIIPIFKILNLQINELVKGNE